jgi:putative phage-type endonuclease
MFILYEDKKCMKQKNYKDLEIAISDFLKLNDVDNYALQDEIEVNEIASVIETIYKDVYCEQETSSDITELIVKMLKTQISVEPPEYTQSELDFLELKQKQLEKIPQPEQRSKEWYEYRNNRLTASDLWSIADWNESKVHDILKKKCGVETKYSLGPALLHGIKFEPVATSIYEKRQDVEIVEFGCLPHPFIPYFGASPDGICGINSKNKNYVGRMLEIKCPKSRVITGFIPEGYRAQMQGQLEVCELEYCDFLECDFQMYDSKSAFIEDSFIREDGTIDASRNKLGFEKGVIFETYNTDAKNHNFKYCDKVLSTMEEVDVWEEPFIDEVIDSDNLEHIGTTFWYLRNISIVLVKRDREWFQRSFHRIKQFWTAVEDARMNGIPEKKKKEKQTKFDMSQFTGSVAANKPKEFVADFNNTNASS